MQQIIANFWFWQGLRWVPLGGPFLVIAATLSPWWPFSSDSGLLAGLVATVGALTAYALSGAYYARTFGTVQGIAGAHPRREQIKWLLVYPGLVAASVLDMWLRLPVFVSGMKWAGAVVAYQQATGRGRRHYVVMAAILARFSVVPLRGLVAPGKSAVSVFFTRVGGMSIVGGILDHREMAQLFRPIVDDSHA